MLKADDLLPLDEEPKAASSVTPMDIDVDDVGQVADFTGVKIDDESVSCLFNKGWAI